MFHDDYRTDSRTSERIRAASVGMSEMGTLSMVDEEEDSLRSGNGPENMPLRPSLLSSASDLRMEPREEGLYVQGDIDLYVAADFRQRALEYIRSAGASPCLDLTEVPFLDSAGLAALLGLSREAKTTGKTLRLRVTGGPRRVLRITGIDRMLALEE